MVGGQTRTDTENYNIKLLKINIKLMFKNEYINLNSITRWLIAATDVIRYLIAIKARI